MTHMLPCMTAEVCCRCSRAGGVEHCGALCSGSLPWHVLSVYRPPLAGKSWVLEHSGSMADPSAADTSSVQAADCSRFTLTQVVHLLAVSTCKSLHGLHPGVCLLRYPQM